jgi:hypothetical protein
MRGVVPDSRSPLTRPSAANEKDSGNPEPFSLSEAVEKLKRTVATGIATAGRTFAFIAAAEERADR